MLLRGDELKINGSSRSFPGIYPDNDINAALDNLDFPFKGTEIGEFWGVSYTSIYENWNL